MKMIKFSIICGALLAFFITSCEQAEFNEMEESAMHTVTIAEMEGSDETSTTNARRSPGLYGPKYVSSGKGYIYTLVLPSGHTSQYPGGYFHVYIQEPCEDCGNSSWTNLVSQQVNNNSIQVTFPDEGSNKKWRVVYQYVVNDQTGVGNVSHNKYIIADTGVYF